MKLQVCIAMAVAVSAQFGGYGPFGGVGGFGGPAEFGGYGPFAGGLGLENSIVGPHSPVAPFTRDRWTADALITSRVTNAPFGQVTTPVSIPLEKVERFIPAPWKPDGVVAQTFAYPNPEGAVVQDDLATARVSEVVAGPNGEPIRRPTEVKVTVVEQIPVPGPTGTETASVYEPVPNEPKVIEEPKKVKLNPNVLSRFTEELYNHGDLIIERVKAIESAGNPQRSPFQTLPPIQVPSGYVLTNLDAMVAKLFFFTGRCASEWLAQEHQHMQMGVNEPTVWVQPAMNEWNACFDAQALYWLEEEFDDYVSDEASKMYKFMTKHPETILTVGYAPAVATFPFPALSPQRINAMRAFPRAFYRMWPTIAQEVTRSLADVGGPLPDFDQILNNVLSPSNIGAFGLHPGFKVNGLSEFVLQLILKAMQCRSATRHNRKYSVFNAAGAWDFPQVENFRTPYTKCVEAVIVDWYGDDWEDLAMDIAKDFGEETSTEVRPAEPQHARPVSLDIIPDRFGDLSVAGEPVIVAGYNRGGFNGGYGGYGGYGP